jgi:hypothetical protein
VHALFLPQERRYSGGAETSVCRPISDVHCPSGSSPRKAAVWAKPTVSISAVCSAGLKKQENWPDNTKERTSRSQEHHEAERRTLVTKLAEISGNPRDACLRFLRELGVNQKRAYREWTKPEQQRLLDLITAMPVEEAAKILRRPVGSVRSMLHRLGMGGKSAPFESPFAPSAVSTFTTNFVLVTVDKCT